MRDVDDGEPLGRELAHDPQQRTDIQFKIGRLYEDAVGDDGRAVGTYLAILEQDGDDLRALKALDRIYERNQRWSELAEIVSRELMLVDQSEATLDWVTLKFKLGQIREQFIGDVSGAIEA